jgi:L-fucose isomerase-like protein
VGVRPQTFETVAYDEIAMARKFGQNVVYTNLIDVLSAARRLADDAPDVEAILADVKRTVPTVTVADDYLLKAAKLEAALAAFWTRNGLSALAMQCWPTIQAEYGISLCALFGRLTGRRMLTACEADVMGAVSMLAQYQASLGADLPHFIDWTIRHREHPNRLLTWHCGNAPTCLAREGEPVALRSRSDMCGSEPAKPGDAQAGLYQFQLKPGPVTFCRLAEYDGEWKMLIAGGEIIPSEETLAGTWAWVEVADHDRLYRTLVEHGFIHHASMIHGDQRPALASACRFLDITPVEVQ